MKLSANVVRVFDKFGIKGTIDLFSKVGFEAIDFNSDIPFYVDKGVDEEYFLDLKKYLDEKGVEVGQTHALFARAGCDPNEHNYRTEKVIDAIKVAKLLGSPCVVVHPPRIGEFPNPENISLYDFTIKYYKDLIPYAEESGVKIAIENIRGAVTFETEGLLKVYEDLNNPVFTICYDVGHAVLAGLKPEEEIYKLKDKIGCTHIHDNDGVHDKHTLPYYGILNWDGICKAFADIGYDNNFNYEASAFIVNLPEDFYEQGLGYMAQVGKYLIDKIKGYRIK